MIVPRTWSRPRRLGMRTILFESAGAVARLLGREWRQAGVGRRMISWRPLANDVADKLDALAAAKFGSPGRSLHHRDLRRFRRSRAPQADSRALRIGLLQIAGAPLCHYRFCAHAMSDDAFRDSAAEAVRKQSADSCRSTKRAFARFAQSFAYVAGEYDQPEPFEKLSQRLEELDRQRHLEGNRLYYLATPPDVYPLVIEQIHKAQPGASRRTANPGCASSSKSPSAAIWPRRASSTGPCCEVFDESQVYRIDHYLGKDTVQNLLVLRFGNGIFEPLWNRNYVDHVQITAAESLGVEQRAAFYETTGALRDMIQSHVLQLTSLVAMEPPSAFDATAVRNEKIKVLQAIRPLHAGDGRARRGARPVRPRHRSTAKTWPAIARSPA